MWMERSFGRCSFLIESEYAIDEIVAKHPVGIGAAADGAELRQMWISAANVTMVCGKVLAPVQARLKQRDHAVREKAREIEERVARFHIRNKAQRVIGFRRIGRHGDQRIIR